MAMFVFDTDHLAIIQRQTEPEFSRIANRMGDFSRDAFHVAIVSFHEQVLGWTTYLSRAKSSDSVVKAYTRLRGILADFAALQVLDFDASAAEKFEELRRNGIRVGTMDLRIASIALRQNGTVLTRNHVDFGKVPGLTVEDWASTSAKPR